MKILIVDDNADDRRLVRLNLEHRGFEVIEAQDGNEGLEKALKFVPDIIISDGLMPVMDGFQFLKKIREHETTKSIPFVFYSAVYTDYDEKNLALSLGADAFIIKPKEPETLWEELSNILEKSRLKNIGARTGELIEEEEEFLKRYSHVVAARLEERVKELKETQAQLIATQERLEHLVSYSPSVIYSLEPLETIVTFISENVTGLLGYTVLDFMENPLFWERHIHPDDLSRVHQELFILQEKGHFVSEYRFRRKDGTYIWLRDEAKTVTADNGDVVEIVGSLIDITERKQAEEKLRESEEKFRGLFESSRDAIMTLEPPLWKFASGNPATVKMFGAKNEEEFIACGPWELSPELQPDGRASIEKAREMIMTAMSEGSHFFEWTHKRIDGSEFYADVLLTRMDFEGKQLLQATVRDITEQKKLEDQLRHAQKMDAVGTLAGGIAHDFNNILNVIIGYGGMVYDGLEAGSPSKEQMNEVLTAAERAANLTKKLLGFSRKQVVNIEPINVNETILGIQKMLRRIIRENIAFTLNLADRPLIVKADNGQMEQVLMNLVANARDAMLESGCLAISKGIKEITDEYAATYGYGTPGMYALITVADTGCGMAKETRQKIFEPFFTTKGIGEGTGLGLAISYGIIKQHGGHIKVYNELGQGTIFTIYLPLVEEPASLDIKTEAAVPVKGGTETILVAEDDASLRKLARTVLEAFGYTVITAEDGEDAVIKYSEHRDKIHLIMLDMIMPKKSGKEASEEIRKLSPGIKTLFMSGYTMDIIKTNELLDAGFDFVQKPVRPQELLKKVREILDR